MAERAKELDNRRDGDRGACPTCRPKRPGRISESDLWRWAMDQPAPVYPLRSQQPGPAAATAV